MDEDRLLEREVGTVLSGLRDIALNRLHWLGTACICRIHVGGLCCGIVQLWRIPPGFVLTMFPNQFQTFPALNLQIC
jgi:hypothetical protein